jgi:purine nucleosidase/pyrimidine-specific ribonucleoside hydrolase
MPVVLDCDPGHDDALAILLAAGSPILDLKMISAVAGNQTVDLTARNAARVCALAGLDSVPVFRGSAGPLERPLITAGSMHGETGLNGPAFAAPHEKTIIRPGDAVAALARAIKADPDPVTIVATGPLTNIARLIRDNPDCAPNIAQIVFMGGSTERGNWTPYAEFNILVDPEAADIVFRSGLHLKMIGLNVTHQVLVTEERISELRQYGSLGETCVELMLYFRDAYERIFGFPDPPLHDPLAVAAVIDESLFSFVPSFVAVETDGTYTTGATVVDLHNRFARPVNAEVALGVNVNGFWRLMIQAIRTLSATDLRSFD